MSPAEDRIAEDAARRGAMLPPTPPDAVQRKTVSREASVTPGKSPARSPHPKAWDASFAKVPAPTLDEASASSSRDRADRMSREKHAHMEARAELLSLIAEAAADADVLGEAFPVIEGDVPGASSVRVALPPPRLAMREIKERRDRERAAEADRARRAEALEKLRKQQRETAAALRERRRADPAAAPTSAAEKKNGGGTRGAAGAAGASGEKENETERDLSSTDPLLSRADREEAARRAEVRAFIAESKARWRVKLAQEKTAARLREQARLEVLKQERAAAREAAREHAAAREAAGEADKTNELLSSSGAASSWDATPADVTETATGKKASSETGAPSPPPMRRVGASPAAAAAAAARETRNRTSAALGRFGVSTHAARAGIGASSSGTISGTKHDSQSANTSRDSSFPHSKEKGKARVARTSARASAELKKRWMEDEARARSAREAAVSGSSLGGSAFVDTAIGARVAEERRLRGEEAKERLRAEIEARLEAAKRAARAAAEDARAAAEKAAPTRAGAAALAAAASAAASAVARRGGQRDRGDLRARVTRVPTVSRAGAEPAPDAKSPAKSALKKTTPTKSPGAETSSSAAETSVSARHISFAATVRESDGAEKPMSMPGGSEEPTEEPSEASGTEGGLGGNRGETEGADDADGAPEDSPADDLLRSRPRLLERMRGPPSTRTVLPGDEHVPRAEDWLGMGQGGGAGRIARRLAKRRAPRDPDAPPLEPPDSREAAEAMKAKAFRALPRDSSARRADIVDDIVAAGDDDDVAARLAARLAAERVSRTHREPRGVLSTYARRTFASLVAPAEAETRLGTEPDAKAAQKPTLSLVSSTSAQTDPVAFVGDRGRSKETPPETSPAPENRAGRRKKPSGKKKAEEKRVAAASRANVDVVSASDGTSDDLDFVPDASRNPLDRRAAFLAACLAEEEAAATAKRQSPDALESRFESELALFEEMGDIAAELDAMRFARDAFDAEQAASKLAAVAESRRVELLGARQTLDAARSAADEYEALTKAAKAGDDSSAEATFTENDIARVAEAITEKMREESLAHLKEVTDAFLADVARGRKDAGDVAAASLRVRLSEGSVFEGSAKEAAVATEPVAKQLPVPTLPVPSELPSEAARESGDPEETSDSIVDEVGGVVPDASRLSESFVPEDSGLFSDDDAAREVEAKHEDVQRRLRDLQRKLKSAELDAKRRRIAEMESRLVELEASAADAETELDFRATEAETAAMADEAESRDLDARLEAHGARVARLEALVEKRRLENLSLRKLTGKETTLREEMKRLDASVEKQTRAAAAAARDAEDSGKKASVSPRVPRLDLSAASPATTRSPSPSPIAQAPDASTSPGSSDAEQVDSESLPEPPESDAASEVSTEPDVSRVSAASAPTRSSPTADAPPSSARAKPVSPKPAGLETISTTPPPLVHTTPGFEALVRSASAHFVDAAARAALDASGATSRGLDSAAAAALESESAFAAIKEIGVDDVRESLLREHGSAIDAKLATEACVAATKSLPARLVRDAVVETVRHAFPRVFESSFGKESTAADGFASALDPPGSSAAGAFAATSALAAAVGGGGLKGERLVDVVAARARAALTASDNAFPASDPRAAEAAEAAAEISAEISDAGGAETPLDAVVRADARESDDLGWYAVRAVEKAVATRLADELFDELVADTVLALVGVGETTSSGARRR